MKSLCAVLMMAAVCACSHGGLRPIVAAASKADGASVASYGAPLSPTEARAFRALMARGASPMQQASMTAKTSRFGPEGRVKVTLQLVLQRPNQFRLTVLGPHGPPLFAAACDGAQLTALNVANKTFRSQPATATGIAHHLGGLDLGLSSEDWVGLLLGEMAVPDDAVAYRGEAAKAQGAVLWRWSNGGRRLAAQYDGVTGLLRQAAITLSDRRTGTVVLTSRGAQGIAERIVLHLSAAGKEGAQDVELSVTDVAPLPAPLGDEAFVLSAPIVPSI